MTRLLLILAALLFAVPAFAQEETETETRSRFTRFVESQLSAENRQIRLNGIEGALSSEAVIREITIADRQGVWLRIENAVIDWNRSALIFGRLEIQRLAADSIEVLRPPLPPESAEAPTPEASGFQVPELPVSVRLDVLEVPEVYFGGGVFGLEATLAVNGSFLLDDGALQSTLSVQRLDGPGGQLELQVAYANETETLDLDLLVSEPADGVLANLLDIEGRPAIELALVGSGPIGDLSVDLTLDADGTRVLTGTTTLARSGAGLAVDADVEGEIARLVAPAFREFFGASTTLSADALLRDGGGLTLNALTLQSGALSLRASAETSADNFLRQLRLEAAILDPNGEAVVLPVAGADTTVDQARLSIDYGAEASDRWNGSLDIDGLTTTTLEAESVELDFGGRAENLDLPERRLLTFLVEGGVAGITTEDPAVAEALGDALTLVIDGSWQAGQPVDLAEARLSGEALDVELSGSIADATFDGRLALSAASIAPFSELAGRDLAGSIDLTAEGTVAPVSGAFDLVLDGSGAGLSLDMATVDRLIESTVQLSGRLARGETGFEAEDFTVGNDAFRFNVDGRYASDVADLSLDISLSDLALISDRVSGPLTLTGTAAGEDGQVALELSGRIPSGELAGRTLTDARFDFTGVLVAVDAEDGQPYGEGVQGAIEAEAFLDGEAVALTADIYATGERRTLDNLEFRAGGATITGNLAQAEDGLLTGEVSLDAPQVETLAALALQEATGSAALDIVLAAEEGRQNVSLDGSISDLTFNGATIGEADLTADIADLFGVPKIEGSIEAASIEAGGVVVETLQASAVREEARTEFTADATLDRGTEIALTGALEELEQGFLVALETFELTQGETEAVLTEPATVRIVGETIEIGELALDVAGGEIRASGTIADELDVDVAISALPLSIANTVVPDLAAAGTIDGTATVGGTREAPEVSFDLSGEGITAAPLREAGLPAIDVVATGRTAGERLEIDANVTGAGGIAVVATGSLPLGEGEIDLDVRLDDLPLATLDPIAGDRGLAGTVSATAEVGGTLEAPVASFDVSGSGVTADQLAELGIQPLAVTANGRFAGETVTLQSATVENGQGLSVSASGTVPLAGAGLDVAVEGSAPLTLANSQLAERGASVTGTVAFNVNVSGSVAEPRFDGSISTSGAGFVDPESNVELTNITLAASLSGQQVTVTTLTADLVSGGSFSVGGTISIDAAAGFPADLAIVLNETRYADGDLFVVTASGNLAVSGALLRDPVISGTINIDNAEIGIPSGGGGPATLTDVRHIAPPPGVARTLERAELTTTGEMPTPTARPSVVRLDVTVNAPNQIFVRGRGLDAELGGSLQLQGPLTDLQPVGGFELIRGRLSILGRRIVFDSGSVTLIGDLDPFVDLRATSESGDTTVIIAVTGRASDIQIDFSSQPMLPEDEVIARLIFNRSISELSAFQIAQLAAAVAELTGGGNTSLLGQLRQATGLDDLDIVTDEEGNAAVRAGRYVRDNVYLGVQAGAGGSSEVTIDLDITENLKARGAAGADGETSIGIFYERDY